MVAICVAPLTRCCTWRTPVASGGSCLPSSSRGQRCARSGARRPGASVKASRMLSAKHGCEVRQVGRDGPQLYTHGRKVSGASPITGRLDGEQASTRRAGQGEPVCLRNETHAVTLFRSTLRTGRFPERWWACPGLLPLSQTTNQLSSQLFSPGGCQILSTPGISAILMVLRGRRTLLRHQKLVPHSGLLIHWMLMDCAFLMVNA